MLGELRSQLELFKIAHQMTKLGIRSWIIWVDPMLSQVSLKVKESEKVRVIQYKNSIYLTIAGSEYGGNIAHMKTEEGGY